MITKYPVAAMMALLCLSTVQAGEHPFYNCPAPNGKTLSFFASSETFLKTPEWIFDGKSLPPLSFLDAYPKALKSVQMRFPGKGNLRLQSYALQRAGFSDTPNRWYYTFDFTSDVAEADRFPIRFTAIVLLNGSVIEPRERE